MSKRRFLPKARDDGGWDLVMEGPDGTALWGVAMARGEMVDLATALWVVAGPIGSNPTISDPNEERLRIIEERLTKLEHGDSDPIQEWLEKLRRLVAP